MVGYGSAYPVVATARVWRGRGLRAVGCEASLAIDHLRDRELGRTRERALRRSGAMRPPEGVGAPPGLERLATLPCRHVDVYPRLIDFEAGEEEAARRLFPVTLPRSLLEAVLEAFVYLYAVRYDQRCDLLDYLTS